MRCEIVYILERFCAIFNSSLIFGAFFVQAYFILFTYQDYVWPNFNIADCLLVCGAILLVFYSFKYDEPQKGKDEASQADTNLP